METHGRQAIRFTLNGRRYELTRDDVAGRHGDVAPEVIRKHAAQVNDTWFPVIQAFEVATGIPRSEFMSNTARRHLSALAYEISGDVEPRTTPPASLPMAASARPCRSAVRTAGRFLGHVGD